MNGVLVEKKLRIRFLSAKHLFMSKRWRCFFLSDSPTKWSNHSFFSIIGFSWSMFVWFFGLSIRKNMFFLKKKGRTFSFVERISLRTWRKLYFHEWVCYRLTKTLLSCSVLDGIAHYCVFFWLIVHTICCFHWAIFFSEFSTPLPLLKKKKILKQLFIRIKLKSTWKM